MRLQTLLAAAALNAALVTASPTSAVTLYDASAGSLPSAQGWTPLVVGVAATQSVSGGTYTLDTTGTGVTAWGNARFSPVLMNTATGFVSISAVPEPASALLLAAGLGALSRRRSKSKGS